MKTTDVVLARAKVPGKTPYQDTQAATRMLPDQPTTAAPGTPEKMTVFEERAGQKRQLFHPFDARYEGDPRPLEFARGLHPRPHPYSNGDSRDPSLAQPWLAVIAALIEAAAGGVWEPDAVAESALGEDI